MIWAISVVAGVGLIGLALVGLIALVLHRSVSAMLSPEARLDPIELEEGTPEYDAVMSLDVWAEANGYGWVGAYVTHFPGMPQSFLATWDDDRGTCVVLYRMNETTAIDIVSRLDLQRPFALTTSNAAGASTLPKRPGAYQQIFPDATPDELGARHAESLEFLCARLRLRPVQPKRAFDVEFLEAIQGQMRYVRSHALWPLRGVLWYLKRKKFDGISVSERYPNLGPADLPD